jgi:hypothetical protein
LRIRAFCERLSARLQDDCEARGLKRLRQWLSPDQLAQFNAEKYFDVIGCDTAKRYRIQSGERTATSVLQFQPGRLRVGFRSRAMAICSLAACLRIEDLFRPICSAIWALLKPCRASFLSCSSSSNPNRSGCLTASLIPILGALFRTADSLLFNSLAMARTRLPAADNSRRIVSSRTVHGRSPTGLSVISSSSARTRPGGGCVSWSVYFFPFSARRRSFAYQHLASIQPDGGRSRRNYGFGSKPNVGRCHGTESVRSFKFMR